MLGAHQLMKLAAALAIGTGIVLTLSGAAGAAQGDVTGPASFQVAPPSGVPHLPIYGNTSSKRLNGPKVATLRLANARATAAPLTGGLFDFHTQAPQDKSDGLLGLSDGGVLAHAFADIPAAPKLLLSFGQGDAIQVDVAQLPIPSTVWLFLAALALLFGISRRQSTANN